MDAKPAEQSRHRLLATTVAASYDGYLFFLRENSLMAQSLDTSRLQLKGGPVPIAERVAVTATIVGAFSTSPSGVLAYRAGAASQNFQTTWLDRQGRILSAVGPPSPYQGFALSPDGTHAPGRDAAGQAGDIWTLDLAREMGTRLTFRRSEGSFPVWSPDGSCVVYSAGRAQDALLEKASAGEGEEKELYQGPGEILIPTSWSRDGR